MHTTLLTLGPILHIKAQQHVAHIGRRANQPAQQQLQEQLGPVICGARL